MQTQIFKKLVILTFGLLPITAFAQFDKFNTGIISDDQEFIKSAVDSAIFVLRQEYYLIDTVENKIYTQDNVDYFGRYYTLAFISDSILWTDNRILEPWLNDTSYNYYNKRYGWMAVPTELSYRALYTKEYTPLKYSIYDFRVDSAIYDDYNLLLKPENFPNYSIPVLAETKNEAGWAFIIYTDQKIEICDTCNLKYSIFKAKPDFENSAQLEKQLEIKNVIGGFYIVTNTQTGFIKFYMAGYLRKLLKWYVWPLQDIAICKNPQVITKQELESTKPDENTSKSKKRKGKQND